MGQYTQDASLAHQSTGKARVCQCSLCQELLTGYFINCLQLTCDIDHSVLFSLNRRGNQVYSFSMAAGTDQHQLSGFTQHAFMTLQLCSSRGRSVSLPFPESGVSPHSTARVLSLHLQSQHGSISLTIPSSHLPHILTLARISDFLSFPKNQFSPHERNRGPVENALPVQTGIIIIILKWNLLFIFQPKPPISLPLLCSHHAVWVGLSQGLSFDHRNWHREGIH